MQKRNRVLSIISLIFVVTILAISFINSIGRSAQNEFQLCQLLFKLWLFVTGYFKDCDFILILVIVTRHTLERMRIILPYLLNTKIDDKQWKAGLNFEASTKKVEIFSVNTR